MTNLKDKLSASVRQAKASIQPSSKQVSAAVPRSKVKVPGAGRSDAVEPTTPDLSAGAALAPTRHMPSAVPAGFALPDRVWPD